MTQQQPTRRSVVKVGAWAAPAIVVAGAAPAFATSVRQPGPALVTTTVLTSHGTGDVEKYYLRIEVNYDNAATG